METKLRIETYKSKKTGKYHFRVVAKNNKIIAHGHTRGYHNYDDLADTILLLQKELPSAGVMFVEDK